LKAYFKKHTLDFITPGGTSRGILKTKDTYFIIIKENERFGIGECGLFKGLSYDDRPDYESVLQWTCDHIHIGMDELYHELKEFPSIQLGIETALRSFESKKWFEIFSSEFLKGKSIPINGLIWMGDISYMKDQLEKKLKEGFNCIKLKIGAIDFNDEIKLLKSIRKEYGPEDIELRVDANGAFEYSEALEKLKLLSDLEIHSIEQPIKQGQWQEMARLCEDSSMLSQKEVNCLKDWELENCSAIISHLHW
jgi:L-alanine-DL-glutamate epimerase-like enolase superfamily enzyme